MNISYKFLPLAAVIITSSATLASCGDEAATVSYGPVTATGTLIRADVSLVRRGTHLLIIDEQPTYFVESRTQNMTELEGYVVFVDGELRPNTPASELPVLLATTVKRSHGDEDMKRFEIPALNIRLGVPETWEASLQKSIATFRLSGEASPLLTIRLFSGSSLPPGGTPLYVKNRASTKFDREGEGAEVYILEKSTVIHLYFDPASQDQIGSADAAKVLAAQFDRILGSLSFITDKALQPVSTGSGSGMPCGGSAGIVCPQGSYCNITDPVERIGQCRAR